MSSLDRRVFAFMTLLAMPSLASADEVTTSFEFTDLSGNFVLGTAPETATFSGGAAQLVTPATLAASGTNAWVVASGTSATISFGTPVEAVTLFFRDELATTASTLTALDTSGQPIASGVGTTTYQEFVAHSVLNGPLIQSILVNNTGASGDTFVDDFAMCLIAGGDPIADPIVGPIPQGTIPVQLVPIATGLIAPNWGTSPLGVPHETLFVSDQPGQIYAINLDSGAKVLFLDVAAQLVPLGIGGPGSFDERGLLGLAFHPNYATNGLLYTYTSEPVSGAADFSTLPVGTTANHQAVITEWMVANPMAVPNPSDPTTLTSLASERELFRVDEPQFNHNGGCVNFGPDGLLYISLGDGGAGDDQGVGHALGGNGQAMNNVLGTVLRIDPNGINSANGRYGIPAGNPFVGVSGTPGEIYAYGLRNPFRFSFDLGNSVNPGTGDLFLGDVGQGDIEEVDRIVAGGNYGWPCKEGSFFFNPNGDSSGFVTIDPPHSVPTGLIDPIAQYDHDEGLSVIGGFVYRGTKIPALLGQYVFAEFATFFSADGRLFHLDSANNMVEFPLVGQAAVNQFVLGFGQDRRGEIYALVNGTGVPFPDGTTGLPTGSILRLAPQAPFVELGMGTGNGTAVPILSGSGPVTPGSSNSIDLTDAPANAVTALIAGTQNVGASLLGAITLIPSPDAILIGPMTDGLGNLSARFTWPATIPAGMTFFVQYVITDPTAPAGFSASTALQVTAQ